MAKKYLTIQELDETIQKLERVEDIIQKVEHELMHANMQNRYDDQVFENKMRFIDMMNSLLNSFQGQGMLFSTVETQKLKNKLFETLESIDFAPNRYKRELLIEKN